MVSPPSDANPSISYGLRVPGYDPITNQVGIAIRAANLVTDPDTSIVYGDFFFSGNVFLSSEYPSGAIPVGASSGNQPNATATVTLPGTSGKTTYIKGFHVTGSGATVGLGVILTVTGLLAGTFSYVYTATAGAILANTPLLILFGDGLPASAANTSIVVSCPALGLGNLNNVVNAWGYQL
jgi:hypothetical protein